MKNMFIFAMVVMVCGAVQGIEVTSHGKITEVTVYRGQAMVTREVTETVPEGPVDMVVGRLPEQLISESLYAQSSNGVKILSVRYRERAVQEDTREEVKVLDEQIKAIQLKIRENRALYEHLSSQWTMYDNLKSYTLEAKNLDLNRGTLTYEPIKNLMDMIEAKGLIYLEKKLSLETDHDELSEELSLIQRKRNSISTHASRTEREAVIYAVCTQPGRVTIELNYLVQHANWQQQYNLRAKPDDSTVTVEYNAVVQQNSGEDWQGVQLKLSTAEPTMVASAPVLEPVRVGLVRRISETQQQVDQSVQILKQNFAARRQNSKQGVGANDILNSLAENNQMLFLNNSFSEVQLMQQAIDEIMRIEGVSVTYDLPGELTLPSRNDQQLVSITSMTTPAQFTLIASPLLTDYVYLQADVHNTSQTVFLPGPASVFKDNQFVGKSEVPLVTIGETFTTGFGTDSQVHVAHALDDKQTRIQGGNRIDTMTFQMILSNYKSTPVTLRVQDRLPYSDDVSIKIELSNTQPALSTDSDYQKTGQKKGLLQWDLTLDAHAIEDKAKTITYTYTMEYDKNMQIDSRVNR